MDADRLYELLGQLINDGHGSDTVLIPSGTGGYRTPDEIEENETFIYVE